MSDQVYYQLREFLDRLPGGYPATENGVEIRILKKLFTPADAKITLQLGPLPEPVSSIAPRLGLSEAEAKARLRDLANRGLIMGARDGNQALFMAVHFVIGIWEFQLNNLDREMAEMMEEYLPYIAAVWRETKTPQLRVVPIGSAIEWSPAVSTYDNIRELAKGKDYIAVNQCICRKERALVDSPCDRPSESCISFGPGARLSVEHGTARRVSYDEFVGLLKMGEEQGLVPSPNNAEDLNFMCMCCGCCCGVLRGIKLAERPADHVQSSFQAKIDADRCTACGICSERCQMDAIKESDRVYAVALSRCIGCGLCVPTCPETAISLLAKPNVAALPANLFETNHRIAKERGLI